VALVLAIVLVSPVVLGGAKSPTKPCAETLDFQGRRYVARPVASAALVEAATLGVGVVRGCGASPSNVDLLALAGVRSAAAVGLTADESSIYVRRGLCGRSTPSRLLGCLRRAR
jgi:hypothetical protein